MKRSLFLLLTPVMFGIYSCGNGNNDTTDMADSMNEARVDAADQYGQNAAFSEDDASFAVEAANGGLTEVELGKLAQQKGSSQKVKDFGSMMVKDHGMANDELKQLAAAKGITLPTGPSEEKQRLINEMSAKSGADFDKAYLVEMVKDHREDVRKFENASNSVKDPDLKAFVDRTLPVLRKHLEHVEGLNNK
jgi:putative membrane protein